MTIPQNATTHSRAGDVTSFTLFLASSSDDDPSFASPLSLLYVKDARLVTALPRKLNRYAKGPPNEGMVDVGKEEICQVDS